MRFLGSFMMKLWSERPFSLPLTICQNLEEELSLWSFRDLYFETLYPYTRSGFIGWTVVTDPWFMDDHGGTTPWFDLEDHGCESPSHIGGLECVLIIGRVSKAGTLNIKVHEIFLYNICKWYGSAQIWYLYHIFESIWHNITDENIAISKNIVNPTFRNMESWNSWHWMITQ